MLYYFALLLPCFTSLFWALIIISKWRTNFKEQNIVAIALLLVAFNVFCFSGSIAESSEWTLRAIINIVSTATHLLVMPLFVRYFRLLINPAKLKWWNNLIFAPAVSITLIIAIGYLTVEHEGVIHFIRQMVSGGEYLASVGSPIEQTHSALFMIIAVVSLLQAVYLLVYAAISLRRYVASLSAVYSDLYDKGIRSNVIVFLMLFLFIVVVVVSIINPYEFFIDNRAAIAAVTVVLAGGLYVLAMSVSGLKHTASDLAALVERIDAELPPVSKQSEVDFSRKGYPRALRSQFGVLIDDQKIFLQPNLSIDQVARLVGCSRIYVRRLIAHQYGKNFCDYINSRRVHYAKALLLARSDMSVGQIAARAGFVSEKAFIAMFKYHNGVGPARWRDQDRHSS